MHASCFYEAKEDDEWTDISGPALSKFLDQMKGIRHLALEFYTWQFLLLHGDCTQWVRNLPWLTDVTVVIKVHRNKSYCEPHAPGAPLRFVKIVPNTVRADSASRILKWSQSKLDKLLAGSSELNPPNLHIVALYSSDQDDNSSEADKQFAHALETRLLRVQEMDT